MGDKQHDPDKERVFVRALQGAYSLKEELTRLRAMPRVIKGKDLKLDGGPQHFSRHYVEPEDGRAQTLHIHLEEYAPGAKTQKHGHVNEAAFYILDGRATRSTKGCATTGKRATSPSCITTACTSTYGVKFSDFFRRADKILQGTKPGDIPIEQAGHAQVSSGDRGRCP
jgi:hypothetical protein